MADSASSFDAIASKPDELRAALLEQLRYLVDEVEVLKAVVDRVPEPVQAGRPTPDALTMKEIYGVIARKDERVHRPRIARIAESEEENALRFEPVEDRALAAQEDWNAIPIHDILERVQAARRALVELLEGLPEAAWARVGRIGDEALSVFEIAHRITQDDARRLRTLSHRLYETNLTGRGRDLPK